MFKKKKNTLLFFLSSFHTRVHKLFSIIVSQQSIIDNEQTEKINGYYQRTRKNDIMTDADTNLSNLTTLWLLLGAYMGIFDASDDFFIVSSVFFRTTTSFRYKKKCSERTRVE